MFGFKPDAHPSSLRLSMLAHTEGQSLLLRSCQKKITIGDLVIRHSRSKEMSAELLRARILGLDFTVCWRAMVRKPAAGRRRFGRHAEIDARDRWVPTKSRNCSACTWAPRNIHGPRCPWTSAAGACVHLTPSRVIQSIGQRGSRARANMDNRWQFGWRLVHRLWVQTWKVVWCESKFVIPGAKWKYMPKPVLVFYSSMLVTVWGNGCW